MNLWDCLNAYPPLVVRLCARKSKGGKNVVALTNPEIAIMSGIPLARVTTISQLLTWDYVTLQEAQQFCAACRFDPTAARDRKRQAIYVMVCRKRRPNKPPQYLLNSPLWAGYFQPLIQRLRSWQSTSNG